MFDENLARIRTHRNSIHRYRRLLRTKLSDLEREFIERRLSEEQTALETLVAQTLPAGFAIPTGQPAAQLIQSDEELPHGLLANTA